MIGKPKPNDVRRLDNGSEGFLQRAKRAGKLDEIDWKILAKLQENARIANVELADEVHLSPSPCLARVRALERDGIISRYVTLLEPLAVGLAARG